jgi:hypothetical protein
MEYDNNHFIIASRAYSLQEDLLMAARHISLQSGRWCALSLHARVVSVFSFGHVCVVAPADGVSFVLRTWLLNSLYECGWFIYKAGRKPILSERNQVAPCTPHNGIHREKAWNSLVSRSRRPIAGRATTWMKNEARAKPPLFRPSQ